MVAIEGLNVLFSLAIPIAILALIITFVSFGTQTASDIRDIRDTVTMSQDAREAREADDMRQIEQYADQLTNLAPEQLIGLGALIFIIIAGFLIIGTILTGVYDYTSAELANNRKVSLGKAFQAVVSNFIPYLWVRIIVTVKTLLWSLLFIVPGIIMAIRYSLAGVAFFDKQLRGNEAVKHSMKLVKGAWLTTFASQTLFNIVTLNFISNLLYIGTNGVLYRQLSDAGGTKPKAHFLSWLTLFLPIIAFIAFIGIIILIVAVFFSV